MAKWYGEAAARHLNRLQNRIINRPGAFLEILHVLAPMVGTGVGFSSSPPFKLWTAGGPESLQITLDALWPEVLEWPYVKFARRAGQLGARNTRVVIIPGSAIEDPRAWQQYLIQVQLPLLATATGEKIIVLASERLHPPGGPGFRPYDVNVWGPVVMLTAYSGPDDDRDHFDIAWRELISRRNLWFQPRRKARRRREEAYARVVLEIAAACGTRIHPAQPST